MLHSSGLTLDALASEMGVQTDTAKTYIRRVKAKYAEAGRPASTKLELRERARADGLVD